MQYSEISIKTQFQYIINTRINGMCVHFTLYSTVVHKDLQYQSMTKISHQEIKKIYIYINCIVMKVIAQVISVTLFVSKHVMKCVKDHLQLVPEKHLYLLIYKS